jgi:hypothetical protein
MRQLAHFQINENEAFQEVIVEDKVDIKVISVYGYPFLSGNK